MTAKNKITSDDPQLTAYALGELASEENRDVEEAVSRRPSLRLEVEATQEVSEILRKALRTPTTPGLGKNRRAEILAQTTRGGQVTNFPSFVPLLGGAIAACVAIGGLIAVQKLSGPATEPQTAGISPPQASEPENAFTVSFLESEDKSGSGKKASQPQRSDRSIDQLDVTPKLSEPSGGASVVVKSPPSHQPEPKTAPSGGSENLLSDSRPVEFIATAQQSVSRFKLPSSNESMEQLQTALQQGRVPSASELQVGEFFRHFTLSGNQKRTQSDSNFALSVEVSRCPWNGANLLARVTTSARPRGNRAPGYVAENGTVKLTFNPKLVKSYRLVGSGTHMPNTEIGLNQGISPEQVTTALYEIVPQPVAQEETDPDQVLASPLSPGQTSSVQGPAPQVLNAKLTYLPRGKKSNAFIQASSAAHIHKNSPDYRFSAAVAAFGMHLDGSLDPKNFSLQDIAKLAKGALGEDPDGKRAAFVEMVAQAADLAE